MTIEVIVKWEREDEIDEMLETRNAIIELLRERGQYMGQDWLNDPLNTARIPLREVKV